MSSATSRMASLGVGRVHLVGLLVTLAGGELGRADRVAVRTVEGRGVFGGIGHDHRVLEVRAFQRRAQLADAAVHHVGGRQDVGAGLGLHQALLDQALDGRVVEDPAALDHAVVAVVGEGVQGDVAHGCRPRGAASFMALTARGMTPSGSAAIEPVASFREPSMCGKMAMAGIPRSRARDSGLGGLLDGKAFDARHRGDRDRPFAFVHHHRPDQVRWSDLGLADEAAGPVGLAQAAQAGGRDRERGAERSWR